MPNRAIAQAKRLLEIRRGPGSLVLPPEYTGLYISFAQNNANGHMGPRKFVQQNLSQLQFQNPGLKVEVRRYKDSRNKKNVDVPAFMQLLKSSETLQQSEKHDVQHLHSDEIIQKLRKITGATEVAELEGGAVIA